MLAIGIDVAAQMKGCGYAVGYVASSGVMIEDAGLLDASFGSQSALEHLAEKIRSASGALIAIDAPLGWPALMGPSLSDHKAGDFLKVPRRELFRRTTDIAVKNLTGKMPLEVGAEKIAHAAHHAVEIIQRLRHLTGLPLPLAWSQQVRGAVIIEVYPGATLAGNGIASKGYRKTDSEGIAARLQIARQLQHSIPLSKWTCGSVDVFDACLCLLAAKDFLGGNVARPENLELAEKEGWIWVRPRDLEATSD